MKTHLLFRKLREITSTRHNYETFWERSFIDGGTLDLLLAHHLVLSYIALENGGRAI